MSTQATNNTEQPLLRTPRAVFAKDDWIQFSYRGTMVEGRLEKIRNDELKVKGFYIKPEEVLKHKKKIYSPGYANTLIEEGRLTPEQGACLVARTISEANGKNIYTDWMPLQPILGDDS